MPPTNYRSLLDSARSHLELQVRERLAADPLADVGAELGRISALGEAVGTPETPWLLDLAWSFIAAVVCIVIILVAVYWRISSVDFGFSIESRAIEVLTSTAWRGIDGSLAVKDAFELRGASTADFRGAVPSVGIVAQPSPIRIDTTGSSLSMPSIPKGSLLRIACLSNGVIEVAVTGNPTEVDLAASEKTRIRWSGSAGEAETGAGFDHTINVPGASVIFNSEKGRPFVLRLKRKDAKLFLSGPIERVSFSEDQSATPTLPPFSSGVTKGEVFLRTLGKTYKLSRFDTVGTKDVKGALTIETDAGECLKSNFEGSATSLQIGRSPAIVNLMPTQLAYLYQEKGVPFFLGIFGTLWGITWGGISWIRLRAKSSE